MPLPCLWALGGGMGAKVAMQSRTESKVVLTLSKVSFTP
jgi:Na+/H+ antiporter NhaC